MGQVDIARAVDLSALSARVDDLAADIGAPTGDFIPAAQKGAAGGVATLDAGGLIPSTQLPPLAITDSFPVADEAAMLALAAQVGDIAIRADGAGSFILRAEPATVLANWSLLALPGGAVTSVDGRTGVVDLSDRYVQPAAIASFTRDRGAGVELPTTDLRRGDVYEHTTLGVHVYTGPAGWRLLDVLNPVTEGVPVYAYGHSYLAGDYFGQLAASRYINRVNGRARFGSLTNRAVSGFRMQDAALDAVGTRDAGKTWAPGSKGVVVLDCTLNDVRSNGGSAQALLGYRHSLQSLLHFLSLQATPTESAAWTHTGGMASATFTDAYQGTNSRLTPGTTGTVSTQLVGTKGVIGAAGLSGVAAGDSFEVLVDGAVYTTFSTHLQGLSSSASGAARNWVPMVIPLVGLTDTTHTVAVRSLNNATLTGTGPFVDYLGYHSATPPTIVVMKVARITAAGYAGGGAGATDATVDAYNQVIDEVVALAATHGLTNVLVCDPRPGWDPATMLGSDGMHPNARGHAHLAAALARTLALVDFAAGVTS